MGRILFPLFSVKFHNLSIKNGFRTQEDWDRHFAMKGAIEKGGIGEWALQSVKDKMGGNDTGSIQTSTTGSGIGTAPQALRTAGKKKIQERPLADYLKCGNKEAVIQCIRRFVSINGSFYPIRPQFPLHHRQRFL